jgi:hypothetical protein
MTLFASLFSLLMLQAAPVATAPATTLSTDLPADFLPEGVEWDAPRHRFLVSSIRQHRIAAVDAKSGHGVDFGSAPGSVLGMHIDARGETLWAVWTKFGHAAKQNEASGLAAWTLRDGHSIGQWPLPDKDARVNLGDLAIIDAHTIVVSDSGTGAIWRFDIGDHRYSSLIASGKFKSPQGLISGREPGTMILADYPTGLWRIALATGEATAMTPPEGPHVKGLDGLYRHGGDLIAVQNGTKIPRILTITLGDDDTIKSVRPWLEMAEGEEPSLGTSTGDAFWFVANGQWSQYDDDLKQKPDAKLQAPQLRSLKFSTR